MNNLKQIIIDNFSTKLSISKQQLTTKSIHNILSKLVKEYNKDDLVIRSNCSCQKLVEIFSNCLKKSGKFAITIKEKYNKLQLITNKKLNNANDYVLVYINDNKAYVLKNGGTFIFKYGKRIIENNKQIAQKIIGNKKMGYKKTKKNYRKSRVMHGGGGNNTTSGSAGPAQPSAQPSAGPAGPATTQTATTPGAAAASAQPAGPPAQPATTRNATRTNNVSNTEILVNFRLDNMVLSVSWSPDSKFLAVGSVNKATIFNVNTDQLYWEYDVNNVSSVSWSPNSMFFAVCSENKATIFTAETFNRKEEIKEPYSEYEFNDVSSVSWSPDSKFLAVGSKNNATIFNVNTGELYWEYDVNNVSSVSWSPNGKFLAVGNYNNHNDNDNDNKNKVIIFNVETNIVYAEYETDDVSSISWSSDSKFFTVGSNNNAKIFKVETYTLHAIWEKNLTVSSVSWSPNGKLLAVGYTNNATIFNLENILRNNEVDDKQSTQVAQVVPKSLSDINPNNYETSTYYNSIIQNPNIPINSVADYLNQVKQKNLSINATKLLNYHDNLVSDLYNSHTLRVPDNMQNLVLDLMGVTVNNQKDFGDLTKIVEPTKLLLTIYADIIHILYNKLNLQQQSEQKSSAINSVIAASYALVERGAAVVDSGFQTIEKKKQIDLQMLIFYTEMYKALQQYQQDIIPKYALDEIPENISTLITQHDTNIPRELSQIQNILLNAIILFYNHMKYYTIHLVNTNINETFTSEIIQNIKDYLDKLLQNKFAFKYNWESKNSAQINLESIFNQNFPFKEQHNLQIIFYLIALLNNVNMALIQAINNDKETERIDNINKQLVNTSNTDALKKRVDNLIVSIKQKFEVSVNETAPDDLSLQSKINRFNKLLENNLSEQKQSQVYIEMFLYILNCVKHNEGDLSELDNILERIAKSIKKNSIKVTTNSSQNNDDILLALFKKHDLKDDDSEYQYKNILTIFNTYNEQVIKFSNSYLGQPNGEIYNYNIEEMRKTLYGYRERVGAVGARVANIKKANTNHSTDSSHLYTLYTEQILELENFKDELNKMELEIDANYEQYYTFYAKKKNNLRTEEAQTYLEFITELFKTKIKEQIVKFDEVIEGFLSFLPELQQILPNQFPTIENEKIEQLITELGQIKKEIQQKKYDSLFNKIYELGNGQILYLNEQNNLTNLEAELQGLVEAQESLQKELETNIKLTKSAAIRQNDRRKALKTAVNNPNTIIPESINLSKVNINGKRETLHQTTLQINLKQGEINTKQGELEQIRNENSEKNNNINILCTEINKSISEILPIYEQFRDTYIPAFELKKQLADLAKLPKGKLSTYQKTLLTDPDPDVTGDIPEVKAPTIANDGSRIMIGADSNSPIQTLEKLREDVEGSLQKKKQEVQKIMDNTQFINWDINKDILMFDSQSKTLDQLNNDLNKFLEDIVTTINNYIDLRNADKHDEMDKIDLEKMLINALRTIKSLTQKLSQLQTDVDIQYSSIKTKLKYTIQPVLLQNLVISDNRNAGKEYRLGDDREDLLQRINAIPVDNLQIDLPDTLKKLFEIRYAIRDVFGIDTYKNPNNYYHFKELTIVDGYHYIDYMLIIFSMLCIYIKLKGYHIGYNSVCFEGELMQYMTSSNNDITIIEKLYKLSFIILFKRLEKEFPNYIKKGQLVKKTSTNLLVDLETQEVNIHNKIIKFPYDSVKNTSATRVNVPPTNAKQPKTGLTVGKLSILQYNGNISTINYQVDRLIYILGTSKLNNSIIQIINAMLYSPQATKYDKSNFAPPSPPFFKKVRNMWYTPKNLAKLEKAKTKEADDKKKINDGIKLINKTLQKILNSRKVASVTGGGWWSKKKLISDEQLIPNINSLQSENNYDTLRNIIKAHPIFRKYAYDRLGELVENSHLENQELYNFKFISNIDRMIIGDNTKLSSNRFKQNINGKAILNRVNANSANGAGAREANGADAGADARRNGNTNDATRRHKARGNAGRNTLPSTSSGIAIHRQPQAMSINTAINRSVDNETSYYQYFAAFGVIPVVVLLAMFAI